MKFQKLRVTGFKSFVEPAELVIGAGLTGIVGPNGCGKSNLVEALRWVMGEASSKNMRANGMDDVVFAGSASRPPRNIAEVLLVLDNEARNAPAGFNDADVLEISRRIEREAGSSYRINGREVRARDVQVLFADAATGARSPAMVRQGQIGELIAAKPQARRRVLEDAAGIAGLHARRHEAELRLKSADANLLRMEDILQQIRAQVEGLKRQARQAIRYRTLTMQIRGAEAMVRLLAHQEAELAAREAAQRLDHDIRHTAETALRQAAAARLQALAATAVPGQRDGEARAAAALQALVLEQQTIAGEEQRVRQHATALERRVQQLEQTLAREHRLLADVDGSLARLTEEAGTLSREIAFAATVAAAASTRLEGCRATLAQTEAALEVARAALADAAALRQARSVAVHEAQARWRRLESEREAAQAACHALETPATAPRLDVLRQALDAALAAVSATATAARDTEALQERARRDEARLRGSWQTSSQAAERLETEVATLRRLFDRSSRQGLSLLDTLEVRPGFEVALAAALGEDLDAAIDVSAPTHWAVLHGDDPSLPPGIEPLGSYVVAPPPLHRRLAQIGIVDAVAGATQRALLATGQRLVSLEGDLWRWDGFTCAAHAPTPVARRLAEKNRLGGLIDAARAARANAGETKAAAEAAQAMAERAAREFSAARTRAGAARAGLEAARAAFATAERDASERAHRVGAATERHARLARDAAEAETARVAAEAALATVAGTIPLQAALDRARSAAASDREALAQASAAVQGLGREAEARLRRITGIAVEVRSWNERRSGGGSEIATLEASIAEIAAERAELEGSPARLAAERRDVADRIARAQAELKQTSDRHAEAVTKLMAADRAARIALEALAQAREAQARSEARGDAAEQRLREVTDLIEHEFGCGVRQLPEAAGLALPLRFPEADAAAKRLDTLRQDRERLGPVNLRAEAELAQVERTRDGLEAEGIDCAEAVKRLRQAIQSLNREGRERLSVAFGKVDGHFRALFTTLFGGGSAQLQLVDSDDPLEAGLEIMVRPPGKTLSTMSLLSGGEQALTALALIFAVFLSNPSPICVLDEVDAPLDDANVERFCDLLDDMRRRTDTRFLAITHNPITMARMDRLFGVTMAERGVSQLVSVDLEAHDGFREAG